MRLTKEIRETITHKVLVDVFGEEEKKLREKEENFKLKLVIAVAKKETISIKKRDLDALKRHKACVKKCTSILLATNDYNRYLNDYNRYLNIDVTKYKFFIPYSQSSIYIKPNNEFYADFYKEYRDIVETKDLIENQKEELRAKTQKVLLSGTTFEAVRKIWPDITKYYSPTEVCNLPVPGCEELNGYIQKMEKIYKK